MKKIMLAIVTVTLLAGAGRAETVAGQDVNVPVLVFVLPPPLLVHDAAQTVGPGTVTRVVYDAQRIICRLKGRMLGSLIQNGMTLEQVERIVGCSPSVCNFDVVYFDGLGLRVSFRLKTSAVGARFLEAESVSYYSFLN